jgi:hypothetical protein
MSTVQKSEEETARYTRRISLKAVNSPQSENGTVARCLVCPARVLYPAWCEAPELISTSLTGSSKSLDSSLKRHTAFIKKTRQSVGAENRDQLLKDIESLSLEKHVDELGGAVLEGLLRCKTEKDVWSAVEVRLHSPMLCCSSHAENGDCWFVDNQRDSSSIPDNLYTESCSFVIYGAGRAVSCLPCWPPP